ncbi:hypothetical protein [Mesorhizobium sp. M0088]|uniref:hypothetical protein n=1 Tax=Mesorhizobium sp. M0088 TaxID=2956873 RepID=UPI00333BDF21
MNDTFQSIGDVTAKLVSRWAWWQSALRGDFGPIHSEPQQGYYRVRGKDGQWEPAAIWIDEGGAWLAYRAGREVRDVEQLWTYACRFPIEHAAYEKAMAGGGFDDEPPAPIGDNSGDIDPFEALRIEYIGEKEQLEEALKKGVKTQADADRVSIWKDRIMKIKSRAVAMFKEEKAPVLLHEREIDDKYRYLAHDKESDTAAMIDKARRGVEAFLKQKRDEENARQQAALAEAAKIRREAEDAAEAARVAQEAASAREADVGPPDDGPSAEEAEALRKTAEDAAKRLADAEREAQARSVSVGRTGAKTSLRTEKVGVVVDYGKAAAALVAMKHPDFIAEINRLAQRAAKAGMPFDGMEVKEQEKVI